MIHFFRNSFLTRGSERIDWGGGGGDRKLVIVIQKFQLFSVWVRFSETVINSPFC